MKTTLTRFTAIILTFVFFMSGIFSFTISASDEPDPPTCLEEHFSKLNSSNNGFVPPNVEDSCPYVAMSMLLSFYDAYWDDDFIVENLDWDVGVFDSSTKNLVKTFSATSERKAWIDWYNSSFVDYELANQGEHLQPYLISLGRFAGYHNNIEEHGYKLTTREIFNFLESYLYNVRGFSRDQVEVCYQTEGLFGGSQAELNQTIINKVSNGYPVIYLGYTYNFDEEINSLEDLLNIKIGHAMVAYSVSDNNDDGVYETINLHEGYNSNQYTTVSDTEYQYSNVAIWLEINEELFPHDCSNNYEDVATGSFVCACNVYYETHLSHTHFHHESYNSFDHFGDCICGNISDATPHNYKYYDLTLSTHHQKCRGCNYEITVDHNYNIFSIVSGGHIAECACGLVTTTQSHNEDNYISRGVLLHDVYCECGYFIRSEAHQMVSNGLKNVCSDCDYVGDNGILPPGLIIKGIEDESDTNIE